jgi:hypothetical protein
MVAVLVNARANNFRRRSSRQTLRLQKTFCQHFADAQHEN